MINLVADSTDEQIQRQRNFIAALRSGRYQQAQGVLAVVASPAGDVVGHCCLGVACEEAIVQGLPLRRRGSPRSSYAMEYGEEVWVLPLPVQRWYGFESEDPFLMVPEAFLGKDCDADCDTTAANLNDFYHFTFDKIADCFECTYLPTDWAVTVAARG